MIIITITRIIKKIKDIQLQVPNYQITEKKYYMNYTKDIFKKVFFIVQINNEE